MVLTLTAISVLAISGSEEVSFFDRHLHGIFITADENPVVEFPCRELLPLFTQTKINECYR